MSRNYLYLYLYHSHFCNLNKDIYTLYIFKKKITRGTVKQSAKYKKLDTIDPVDNGPSII